MTTYWECTEYDGEEEKELRCPKCGCPKLVLKEEEKEDEGTPFMSPRDRLGEKAICFECRHEFIITENCWKKVIQ
jgi:ssDNA-binding Zn-finger/Zn-ribbon topoisomerase 1